MCRLTICNVTREGIADNKTFPEINKDGKEKIIGSPVVNASRHAFRDAAEQFGICAYLDEQQKAKEQFIQYMRRSGDGRAYKLAHDNGWLESPDGQPVKPKPRPPEKPGSLLDAMSPSEGKSLYPQNNPVVKRVRDLTGQSPDEVIGQCKVLSQGKCDRPDQLNPSLLEQLLESLVLKWCASHFPSVEHAQTAYKGKIQTLLASGVKLEDAIASFIESVKATKNHVQDYSLS